MQEAYVNICDVPTHIITWGKWIEQSLKDTKELVICIPGNPGLPGFYTTFLSTVHEKVGRELPVWVIGHVGHDDPPATSIRKVPKLKGNEELYDLNGQVKHKIEFIRKYVPEGVKVHLIGHSIGAWMILELLKHADIKERVQKCYMLFPTVERMAISSNGRYLTRFLAPLYFLFQWLWQLFLMLPLQLRTFLFYVYFLIFSIPKEFLGTVHKYANMDVLDRSYHLGMDEMRRVKQLDVDVVRENKDKIKFYYGRTDGWVPIKYYEELKAAVPGVEAELDNRKIEHAFVLRSSEEMGRIVADWIAENRRR